MNRREFLKLSIISAGSSVLSSCSFPGFFPPTTGIPGLDRIEDFVENEKIKELHNAVIEKFGEPFYFFRFFNNAPAIQDKYQMNGRTCYYNDFGEGLEFTSWMRLAEGDFTFSEQTIDGRIKLDFFQTGKINQSGQGIEKGIIAGTKDLSRWFTVYSPLHLKEDFGQGSKEALIAVIIEGYARRNSLDACRYMAVPIQQENNVFIPTYGEIEFTKKSAVKKENNLESGESFFLGR